MKNKSTYSLLVDAEKEEKNRSLFEIGVYGLVLLCMAISGWHFASTSVTLPKKSPKKDAPQSMVADAPIEQPPVIASQG